MRHYVLPRDAQKNHGLVQTKNADYKKTPTLPFFLAVSKAAALYTTRRLVAAAAAAAEVYTTAAALLTRMTTMIASSSGGGSTANGKPLKSGIYMMILRFVQQQAVCRK